MEAIGERGELDLSRTRSISELLSSGYSYFKDGDVVFAKITPCFENGKGALIQGLPRGFGFGTTELIVLRPMRNRLIATFLDYLVRSDYFRRIGESRMYGAGGQKRVPDAYVRGYYFALPPLEEQKAIAAFLDRETAKIDGLIAEQERLIELLKEKRQAVISHGVTKGVNEGAVKKHSGVQWIGEIPQKWTVCEVRRVVNQIEQGWSPECLGRHAELSEWGVLKTGCVNYGRFAEQENKALPDDLTPATEYEVRPGDVIMSRANGSPELVGATAIVESVRPRLMLSDKLFRFGFGKDLDPRFFVLIFNARYMRAQIERAISGAEGLANNLPQSALKSFVLALPPMAEQSEIVKRISAKLQEIDRLGGEAATYIALAQERRSALITAAVTGQIDVRGLAEQKAA